MADPERPKLGAIAVVLRGDHVLLARRGKAPDLGLWGFPGGHVELGETALAAAVRELHEETGVTARAVDYLTNVDVLHHDPQGALRAHYLLAAVLCDHIAGEPRAVTEILEAAWVPLADLRAGVLPTSARVAELAQMALDRQSLRS